MKRLGKGRNFFTRQAARNQRNEVSFNKLQSSLDNFAETRSLQAYLFNFCDVLATVLATNIEKNTAS